MTDKGRARAGYAILGLHIGALVLYHALAYLGHYGFDDLHYAKLAHRLMQGWVDYGDHYTYRLPILLLTGLSYQLFGITDWASALPSLLVATATLCAVYGVLRRHGLYALCAGLSLTTFSAWFLFYSDKLMPDIYVALAVLLALSILHHHQFWSNGQHPGRHALLLASVLLLGFMAKETIILTLPLFLLFFGADVWQRRHLRFWGYAVGYGALLLGGYLAAIWHLSGSPLGRFEAIAANSYLNACSYDQQSAVILWRRITVGFISLLHTEGILVGFLLVGPAIIWRGSARLLRLQDPFSFFAVSSFALLLASNFMSISTSAYSPMCLDVRHYLFLIPVVAIPAALVIAEVMAQKRRALPLIATLLIAAGCAYWAAEGTGWVSYLLLAGLLALYYLVPSSRAARGLFLLGLAAILLIKPLGMAQYAHKVQYRAQKAVVLAEVLGKQAPCYVITDEVQKRLGEYYTGFDTASPVRFLSFGHFDPDTLGDRRKLLFLNWYTAYLSNTHEQDLPYYARNTNPQTLIFEDSVLNIRIYALDKLLQPAQPGHELFRSANGFEDAPPPFWSQAEADLTTSLAAQGKRSAIVQQYSPTLSYPLDSLPGGLGPALLVVAQAQTYFHDKTNAQLVLSVEDAEGIYIWQGLPVNKYLKSYSHWWPVRFEAQIDANAVKPGSVLKAYLWHTDAQLGYLDEVEVAVYRVAR